MGSELVSQTARLRSALRRTHWRLLFANVPAAGSDKHYPRAKLLAPGVPRVKEGVGI